MGGTFPLRLMHTGIGSLMLSECSNAMQDLNDVLLFASVVEHNGFTAAAHALNRPKSSVSRHVDRLERRLGVRLLERSTRQVRLTQVGRLYYDLCRAALAELKTAEAEIALQRVEPVGVVRMSCPTGIAKYALASIVPIFMARYPDVRLHIQATNDAVDLIKDNIDVAIRARTQMQDEALTMRKLGASRLIFVASPVFLEKQRIPSDPLDVSKLAFLSFQEGAERPTWIFQGPDGSSQKVTFDPSLWTSELDVLVAAACAGAGVALLPAEMVRLPMSDRRLVRVLPDWQLEDVTVHLVFPTGRGLRPAVRVLIDYLVEEFPRAGGTQTSLTSP